MSKKIILLVVGVLVIGGAAAFMLLNKNDSPSAGNNQSDSTNQSTENNSEETAVEGNLKTLAGGGKAQECSMSYSGEDGQGSGKMYTDGRGRGRMQLNLVTERGNQGESNTLITGAKVYTWTKTDGGAFGFVLDADDVQVNSTGSPTTSSSQTAGKNFSLKCKSWNIDEAVLTVPADVNFTTLPSTP